MNRWVYCVRAMAGLALGLVVGACSSPEAEVENKPMSQSMQSRMMDTNMNKRSSFESAMVTQNSGMGSYLEKQGYKAKEYSTNKEFQVPKTLKQGTFSRADQVNGMGSQSFQGAGKKSRMGESAFATKEAREGSMEARQQGQLFGGSDKMFKTGEVWDAAKSQQENKRPKIVKPNGGQVDETPYTEDEIRQMVNRR